MIGTENEIGMQQNNIVGHVTIQNYVKMLFSMK